MIKSKEGKVKIKGSRPMVMAELSVIFTSMSSSSSLKLIAPRPVFLILA